MVLWSQKLGILLLWFILCLWLQPLEAASHCDLALSRILAQSNLSLSQRVPLDQKVMTFLQKGLKGEALQAKLQEDKRVLSLLHKLFKKSSRENQQALVNVFKELKIESLFEKEITEFRVWKQKSMERAQTLLNRYIADLSLDFESLNGLHSPVYYNPDLFNAHAKQLRELLPVLKKRMLEAGQLNLSEAEQRILREGLKPMLNTWRGKNPELIFVAQEVLANQMGVDATELNFLRETLVVRHPLSLRRSRGQNIQPRVGYIRHGASAILLSLLASVAVINEYRQPLSILVLDQAVEQLEVSDPRRDALQRQLEITAEAYLEELEGR